MGANSTFYASLALNVAAAIAAALLFQHKKIAGGINMLGLAFVAAYMAWSQTAPWEYGDAAGSPAWREITGQPVFTQSDPIMTGVQHYLLFTGVSLCFLSVVGFIFGREIHAGWMRLVRRFRPEPAVLSKPDGSARWHFEAPPDLRGNLRAAMRAKILPTGWTLKPYGIRKWSWFRRR